MLSQSLTLEFKKSIPRPILTVRRADGTSTWMKLYPGMALHDLAHYAIETILELPNAFYGTLAEGYNIEDFEAPKAQRPAALIPENLPVVALQVEHMVNLLLTELQNGQPLISFRATLAEILANKGLGRMDVLTETALGEIRLELERLRLKWNDLPEGQTMRLMMQ